MNDNAHHSSVALESYLHAQQMADKGLRTIADNLLPGMSELDCALLIRDWLRGHDVYCPDSLPQVRFTPASPAGRPRRTGNRPGKLRYRHGMAFMLHCQARVDGALAAASLTGSQGVNAPLGYLQDQLRAYRQRLPDQLQLGITPAQNLATLLYPEHWQQRFRRVTDGLRAQADRPLPSGLWQVQVNLHNGQLGARFSELLLVAPEQQGWLADLTCHRDEHRITYCAA